MPTPSSSHPWAVISRFTRSPAALCGLARRRADKRYRRAPRPDAAGRWAAINSRGPDGPVACATGGRLTPLAFLAVQALIRHVTNRPGPQALSRRHPEASPAVAQRCATPAVGTPGHQGRVASGAPSKRWPQHQVSCLPAPPGHPNPLLPTRRPQYVTVTNIVAAQGC